jgi:phosphoglucosamine mutase
MNSRSPPRYLRMGKAVANVLRSSGPNRNRVLVGKDTRISGYMLETR